MSTTMYVNGQSMLEACGLTISEPGPGVFSTPDRTDDVLVIPSLPGAVLSTIPGSYGSRTIDLQGAVVATSLSALNTQMDALRSIMARGLLEVIFAHDTTRFIRCRATVTQGSYAAPAFRSAGQKVALVTISLRADDPWYYSTAPSLVSFGSTGVAIPLGTAASRGRDDTSAILRITGSATTPTVTYRHGLTNDVIGTMAFTWSPTVADAIEIDLGRRRVRRCVTTTWSNAMSYLTAGYAFPDLDPEDGDYYASRFPTLEVSGLGADGSAFLSYWKAWK